VLTNILIVASHKTKIKKSSPIAIPSSYIYKLSQSSNHEIRDYFYNEDIACLSTLMELA
jgi:hypothetical protein